MCSRVLWCKILFISQWLLMTMTTTSGSIKHGRNYEKEVHVFSRYQDLNLKEFSSTDFGNYTTLYFMKGTLLVGARNYLLAFNTSDLKLIKNVSWIPSQSMSRNPCIKSGIPQDQCYNFVRVVTVFNNKLLSCGTNSYYPTCMWRNMETLQLLTGTSPFFGKGFVPFDPHSKSVYTFSDDGRFFSGLVMESSGHDKAIAAWEFRNSKPLRQLRTVRKTLYWLDDPVFHASFLIGDYIYFFFDEFARECSDCDAVRYSRVARICKGDDGGNDMMLWINFVTFQKARLNCSLSGSYPYHFNSLRDVFWDAETTTFYGIFTTERSYIFHTSAICSYSLSDIENVFNGSFIHKEGKTWEQKINPGHIDKCKVNKHSIRNPRKIKAGRMQTASLRPSALYEQSKCILTSDIVQPRSNVTPFYLNDIRFVRVVTITFQTNHDDNTEVWYIATDQGTILKLSRVPISKEFCVFEEYEIFQNKNELIKAMELSPDKDHLIVGSDNKLIKVPLLRCDNYARKRSCLANQDPLCGWSSKERKCIPWDKRDNADWKQSIRNCPQRKAMWSTWSPWGECRRHDGNLCKCRRRTCIDAREFYECHGKDIELMNCTVDMSTLTDKNDWKNNGVVHGGWSEWSDWSNCLRGYKNKSRTCTKPSPKNGGLYCNKSDKEYILCEPTRFDDAVTFMWTRWNRIRGPERKATRYKISCTSKAVVMKSLQINMVDNETINCTKDICVDPHKRAHRFLTSWGPWISCDDGRMATLRTRQLCVLNVSRQWSCDKQHVESTQHVHVTTDPPIPKSSQWSPCVCDHDITTAKSYGIQHRNNQKKERIEYRTCPCKVLHIQTEDTVDEVQQSVKNKRTGVGQKYSLEILITVVAVCCVICIIITVVLLVLCHRKKERKQNINNNSKSLTTGGRALANGNTTRI